MKDLALAIDVGATKIALGLVARDGTLVAREDIPSQVASLDQLNQSLAGAIKRVMVQSNLHVVGAGIGSAGPIDRIQGRIKPVNIGHWVDFSLVDFVREVSGISQVRLIGDASALAFAEFELGAGMAAKKHAPSRFDLMRIHRKRAGRLSVSMCHEKTLLNLSQRMQDAGCRMPTTLNHFERLRNYSRYRHALLANNS